MSNKTKTCPYYYHFDGDAIVCDKADDCKVTKKSQCKTVDERGIIARKLSNLINYPLKRSDENA